MDKKNSKNILIKLKNVWKKYEMGETEPLIVLRDINLEIYQGEFLAITGPSGSGKSTIANLIGALDKPSYGEIFLKGKDIEKMSESSLASLRGKTIGFIFQQFNLLPTLNALENVTLPMEMIDTNVKEAKERAKQLLRSLDLGERFYHKPNQLSGGQQQRVAIARALSNNPEIILADEPTGNLDSKIGKFVINFLLKLHKEGKTVILITHDLELIKYAQRRVYLLDGRIEKIEKIPENR
jgi:putative ABC transport system ATP-binding protein